VICLILDCDCIYSFTFVCWLFSLLNVANKITDGNPLKTKPGIFIDEQGGTSVECLLKGATAHENLRTTGLLSRPIDLRDYVSDKIICFFAHRKYFVT